MILDCGIFIGTRLGLVHIPPEGPNGEREESTLIPWWTKKSFFGRLRFELRFWFYETFGQRTSDKTYIGHGDFLECYGWQFRRRFVPCDPVEYKEYLEKLKRPAG